MQDKSTTMQDESTEAMQDKSTEAIQDQKGELWQDKYKNVMQSLDMPLIQRTLMMLDILQKEHATECTPEMLELLAHVGLVQIQEVEEPLPELQVMISNARLVVRNAFEEMEASMKKLAEGPATL